MSNNCVFSHNADNFCCSNYGKQFRENILKSETPLQLSNDYNRLRNKVDNVKDCKQDYLTEPTGYTFTPQERWYTWCDRAPKSINQTGVPCGCNNGITTKLRLGCTACRR